MNVLFWISQNLYFFTSHYKINNMRLLKKKENDSIKDDIVIVEGAISSYEQKKKIEEIRKRAKMVVAIGSCAITGFPSNNRNFLRDAEVKEYISKFNQLDRVYSVKEIIKVDREIPGCPVLLGNLEKFFKDEVILKTR